MTDDDEPNVQRAMAMRKEVMIFFRNNQASQAEMAACLVTCLVTVIAMTDDDEQREDGIKLANQQIRDGVRKLFAIRKARRNPQ